MTSNPYRRAIIPATLALCGCFAAHAGPVQAQQRVPAAWKSAAIELPPLPCDVPASPFGSAVFGAARCSAGSAIGRGGRQESPSRSTGRSFLIESLGGTVGSATGLLLGLALADPEGCNNEDLECLLEKLGIGLAASGAGAAAGTLTAGHLGRSHPSTIGTLLGAVAGIPAGIGVTHLLSEELDLTSNGAALFLAYAITHGVTTALGSRLGAWLRGGP